jgi:hypothetical protein
MSMSSSSEDNIKVIKPMSCRVVVGATTANSNNTNANISATNKAKPKADDSKFRTKEERVAELMPAIIKIRELGISEEFVGIAKFMEIVREFINNGTSSSGIIKVPEIGRDVAYLFNNKKKFKIDIVLKKS